MAPNDALPRSEKDGAPRLGGGMVRRGDDATAVSGGVEIHRCSSIGPLARVREQT